MPSPILARADALMHRRRQNDVELDDVPVLTDAVDDDDIPVLLDVEADMPVVDMVADEAPEAITADVTMEEDLIVEEPTLPASQQPSTPTLDPGLRDLLVHELARRVEQRLSAELPRIIESTVRDFLAEQEMIASATAPD